MDKIPETDPDAQVKATLNQITRKLMVMSGKGGVGKSSVSVNLATALATKGFHVGLMDVDRGPLDFLIIDAPPGTGDEPLTVAQLIRDARAVVVTTPQEVALADVRKSIRFCKQVNMEILGLLENMSGYACPSCGHPLDIFGTGGGKRTAEQAGFPFLGRIPIDPALVSFGDKGRSIQVEAPASPVSKAFKDLTNRVETILS